MILIRTLANAVLYDSDEKCVMLSVAAFYDFHSYPFVFPDAGTA